MIERQKPKSNVSIINNKKNVDSKIDNNTGTEVVNNINIKIQPSTEPPKKKVKRKYKKRISKQVVDDFLSTLKEYTSEGGSDTGVSSVTDLKKLSEPQVLALTDSLKNKILAIKASKEQLALTAPKAQLSLPAPQLSLPATDYSQIPPRQSSGFQRSSLPPPTQRPSLLPPPTQRPSSLQPVINEPTIFPPTSLDDDIPFKPRPTSLDDPDDIPFKKLLPRPIINPLFEEPKFLSGLTESERVEVDSDEYEDDSYIKLKDIYKKYFGYEYKPLLTFDEYGQIDNLRLLLTLKDGELQRTLTTDPKFEDLPEEKQDEIGLYNFTNCSSGRRGMFNPCLGEYENYLKHLIETNDRNEINTQYEKALGRRPLSVSTNVSLVNDIIELSDYVPKLATDSFYRYEDMKRQIQEITPEDQKLINIAEDEENLEVLQSIYKKYFGTNYEYKRENIGERVFDIIQELNTKAPDIQEGRGTNLTQAITQRINENNEVTIALLVTLASYDVERPAFIYQYDYIPELSDAEIAVYYETDGRNIVVGNRGSTTLQDWVVTDITVAFGKLADSSDRFRTTLQKIINISNYNFDNNNDLFIFTGDSLGGSLSYEQAVYVYQNREQFNMFDSYAITFNAGQGLPSSSQFFAFLKENLFNDEWYKTHLLNFTVTGDIVSNLGRAIGAGTQISVPWSVGSQPHNLQNFVKFNVDSYNDFVNSEQAPRIVRGNEQIPEEEKKGYDYKTLGLVVAAGVLAGAITGAVTKNPQLAARAGYYSTRALGPTVARGVSLSGRNIATGALAGGTIGSVEEGIRQNLIEGSKPQYFGTLPAQYRPPKVPIVRLGKTTNKP